MTTRTHERTQLDVPKSRELLEGLLTLEGSTGETYRRFHNYSPRNIGFLALQGCPPAPVATYKKWADLGFHVQKGEKAYSILRPINVKVRDEAEPDNDDRAKLILRFKLVKALFHFGQVAGEGELPPYEPSVWNSELALSNLDITRVPFESYEANMQGYSYGRNIAINPVAVFPHKTEKHEIAHILHGHTAPDEHADYLAHRGLKEFEAEASAYVVLNELGELSEEAATVSRGYVSGWLKDERPPEASLRAVLNVSTSILNAGFQEPTTTE